jgi:hypothetical protein
MSTNLHPNFLASVVFARLSFALGKSPKYYLQVIEYNVS